MLLCSCCVCLSCFWSLRGALCLWCMTWDCPWFMLCPMWSCLLRHAGIVVSDFCCGSLVICCGFPCWHVFSWSMFALAISALGFALSFFSLLPTALACLESFIVVGIQRKVAKLLLQSILLACCSLVMLILFLTPFICVFSLFPAIFVHPVGRVLCSRAWENLATVHPWRTQT